MGLLLVALHDLFIVPVPLSPDFRVEPGSSKFTADTGGGLFLGGRVLTWLRGFGRMVMTQPVFSSVPPPPSF